MSIQEIKCSTWVEFKSRVVLDQFPDGLFKRNRFLFRGQGGASWLLQSSFDRWYSEYGGNRTDKVKVADQLLERFAKECELEDISNSVRDDKLSMLSLAQHNGLPTRLLDWSESPYVAAFFAFSGHIRHGRSTESDVAVWVLDSNDDIWNAEYGCAIVNVPSFGNQRIRNQHGRFTLLKTPASSIEEYVSQFPDKPRSLLKYLIPISESAKAVADLDSMGLNHSRIYPGLTGNAKAAEVFVVLNLYSNVVKV